MVCLHGLASNATRFHEWMSQSRLRGHCALAALDLRGHGRSLTYRSFSRAHWCGDLHALLNQEQRHAVIIGHSMGAQVALEYACLAGHRARGLLLIDPVFPQALSGVLRRVARWRGLLRAVIALFRAAYRLGWPKRAYVYRDLYALDQQTRAFLAAHPDQDIASLYMNPFSDLEFIPWVNYLQDLYEVTRPLPALSAIQVPVLVLLSKGASTSDSAHNQRILSTLAHGEIQVIDADHWLLTEKPAEAQRVIDAWCAQLLQLPMPSQT
ncbi:MAG: alpha/beta hydrolase [Gammaproteobacteria bacterium]|nr:alpha/beta hydrolase [Gammaproteobacteria bacterium]